MKISRERVVEVIDENIKTYKKLLKKKDLIVESRSALKFSVDVLTRMKSRIQQLEDET